MNEEAGIVPRPLLERGTRYRVRARLARIVLTRIIDMFDSDAPRLLGELHKAVDASDTEALRHAAHSLKSNCADVGAKALATTCRDIEQCARMADVRGAITHVGGIQ